MTNSQEKSFIKDLSSHCWRTEIPSILEYIGLDPYEFRLYSAYKSAAGDNGGCWKSNTTLSKQTKIGVTKLKAVKKALQIPREELGGLALIKVTSRTTDKGDPDTDLIEINDIWPANMRAYLNFKEKDKGGSPHDGGVGHETTGGGSPDDHKEEPIKKNTLKEEFVANAPVGSLPSKIEVKNKEGTFSLDEADIYQKIVQEKVHWSADEITYAINALRKYSGEVYNWWSFLSGIVLKFRNAIKNKRATDAQVRSHKHKSQHKEKGSCKTSIQEQNFFKSNSLDNDTSEQPLPTLVCLGDLLKK